jgi:hypothetical protein
MDCRGCLEGAKTRCEFEVPGQEVWEVDGCEYRGCPYKIVTRESANFLRAFNFCERGFLPNPGGWMEQPAKMLDAFDVIEKELKKIETERLRKRNLFKR